MKERPILFSAPMVRAILDGRKTQTRRVVKPQPYANGWWHHKDIAAPIDNPDFLSLSPYGFIGDRLWVRETWCHFPADAPDGMGENTYYRADPANSVGCEPILARNGVKWRPSIFMPRWASRLLLEVTAIRVERLQELDDADAQAEGCPGHYSKDEEGIKDELMSPVEEYAELWDSLNSKRPGCSWADNPWVWVLTFKRVAS
jgi:hypothetical protein